MLARIRKSLDEKDQGFTLIELLVVMIIIGILAAIAIPVFLNQRKKAVDSSIKSDLKTVANAIEDYAVDNTATPYVAAADNAAIKATFGVTVSPGNLLTVTVAAGGGYCITGTNPNANASTPTTMAYWYDSALGGLQSAAGAAPAGGACA